MMASSLGPAPVALVREGLSVLTALDDVVCRWRRVPYEALPARLATGHDVVGESSQQGASSTIICVIRLTDLHT